MTFANIKLRDYRKVKLMAYDEDGYLLEVDFQKVLSKSNVLVRLAACKVLREFKERNSSNK